METKNIKEKFKSRTMRNVIGAAGIALMIFFAFWAGTKVGFTKAAFSYKFGDSYYGAYGPNGIKHGLGIISDDISPSHGVSGKIVSVNLQTLVVADDDNVEKVVQMDSTTVIRKLRDTISAKDLTPGDFVVVIGTPNAKTEVEAKFIRVMPAPKTGFPEIRPE